MINCYSGDIEPYHDIVFVFGSNPIGINGNPKTGTGGAALVAVQKFGVGLHEVMNNRLSDSGRAYGLVTVTAPGKKKSLTKQEIINNIFTMYETARKYPLLQFMIAYRNTYTASLNGYTGKEMAEMFKAAGEIPKNVWVSKEWYNEFFKNDLF